MAAKTLLVLCVVLTVAVMAVEYQDCSKSVTGIKHFTVRNFCKKVYYVLYASHPMDAMCTANRATCNDDGTVTIESKVYINGVLNATIRSIASDIGPGVILRQYPDNPSTKPITQVVNAYTEYPNGYFKTAYVLCREESPVLFRRSLAANFEVPDFTDELDIMNNIISQEGNIQKLPTTCFGKVTF